MSCFISDANDKTSIAQGENQSNDHGSVIV